jgi:hypothetical protein
MIDRSPNKVAITSSSSITTHGQMRRLLHQGARHGTVDLGDASDDVFLLLHLWAGFLILTGRTEPSGSSTGLPV